MSATAILLAGCSGSGAGLDENGRPLGESGGGETPLTADFASLQQHIFTPLCTGCHAGAGAPLGLRLTEDVSYASIVNTPSVEVPSLQRVTPGNPDASYLLQKVSGTAAVGDRMPLGGPPLSPDLIATLRQWIADGAMAPAATAAATTIAPKMIAVLPIPEVGMSVAASDAMGTIVLAASSELDATSLDVNTITLMRSGGDGSFLEGNEVAVPIQPVQLRTLIPATLAITPQEAWVADRYRLTVSGSNDLAVRDLLAQPIDGDSDGRPGGDFVLEFEVTDTGTVR